MKRRALAVVGGFVLVVHPLFTPAAAATRADPSGARSSIGGPRRAAPPTIPHALRSRLLPSPPLRHRAFDHRFSATGVPLAVVVYAPPLVYDPSTAWPSSSFDDPPPPSAPVAYQAPPAFAPGPVFAPGPMFAPVAAPPPGPLPRVVEYATGRYELDGDMVTPYRWVWIPHPPAAPPAEGWLPRPAWPGASAASDPGTARRDALYHWTDAEGVEHWMNRRDTVPN
jgi:hypothetical protein